MWQQLHLATQERMSALCLKQAVIHWREPAKYKLQYRSSLLLSVNSKQGAVFSEAEMNCLVNGICKRIIVPYPFFLAGIYY